MSNARDIIFVGVVLALTTFVFFGTHYVMNTAVDEVITNPSINTSTYAVDAFNSVKSMSNRMDYIIFAIFVGMTLAVLVAGWLVAGNPLFMFLYILVLGIGIVISSVLTYVWDQLIASGKFPGTIAYFPIGNHLLSNLPIYIAVLGFLGIMVMFGKMYYQQEY